ncbi:hypothetical protein C7974DRAFT_455732 [Boeremia exigua]|uniref:uncharacterized protein n=1 Tax=Boeremia exigua TaxID=749465 RepID=UPI001E8E5B65|nr:uncharacterized protein C7974DRAFT_455732 [Boeremia exigua]KAH6625532.1 hypothetical protein C7974DRAFT_455732 [Boeremia exigua]
MCNERSSTSTVDIADNSDVILIVGPKEKRLRVSSLSLANASKVFRSMFGPHFREGQKLGDSSSCIREVPMPEDNADAMEIICNIIHFRSVPENINADLLLHAAIEADKFNCRNVVHHASTLWLNQAESKELIELAQLMASSYLLNNSRAFGQITLKMIFCHQGSYLPLAEQEIGLDLTVLLRICCLLEERRALLISKVAHVLFEGAIISCMNSTQCSCAWSETRSHAYVELLQSEALQPRELHKMSLTQIMGRIDNLRDPVLPQNTQQASCSYRWHSEPNYRGSRGYKLDLIKAGGGLCIDCVQRGAGATTRECRMKR